MRTRFFRSKQFLQSVAAIAVLCAFALALLWGPVVRGEIFLPIDALLHLHPWRYSYERVPVNNPINTDPIKQIYPRRVVTNDLIKQGAWPLWNPTVLTGTPNLPDGQINLFYPPALLFLIVPLAQAFGYYAFLHVCLAGVGAYVFARQLNLSRGPATLAGVCYLLNGYLLTWLYFPHHTGATALLPWCFWAADRAVERNRWSAWALAGVIFALPVLSHLQIAFYIYIGVACYILFRLVQVHGWQQRMRVAVGAIGAVILALGLCAVQLAPGFAQAAESQRSDFGFADGSAEAQFTTLLRLVFPLIGGIPRIGTPPAWGPALVVTPMPYIGIAPLALALLALLFSRHPASFFFGVLAIVSFALAVESPLLALVQQALPIYRQFTDQTRWFVLWEFAAAILAAMGAQALRPHAIAFSERARVFVIANRMLLGGLVLFLAVWSLMHLQLFTPQSRYGTYITMIRQQPLAISIGLALLTALALGFGFLRRGPAWPIWSVLIVLAGVDLLWHGGSYNTSVSPDLIRPTRDLTEALAKMPPTEQSLYPPTRQTTFLQHQLGPFRILGADYEALPPNLASAFGLEDIRGYQSLYAARYNQLARLIDGKDYTHTGEGNISLRAYFTTAYNGRRLLNMLNVKYLIFTPGSENPDRYAPLELVQRNDEGSIYRNPQALPRAWIVHQVEVIPEDEEQLNRLASQSFDPATAAIVDTSTPPVAPASGPESTPEVSYAPDQATVRAHASAPGLLMLSDAYSDDWSVTVDGQPAPLYRANYVLRGVWLPAGDHVVMFTYRPRAFIVGGMISLVTLAALVAYTLWHAIRMARVRRAALAVA
ncbi:MAG TPA: YfhO family protein [Roseiflexaceae bacterium]|nr:YfhO family protein [Roseiflexaceae bacterium]